MKSMSPRFSVAHCRHHGIVWIILLVLWWSFLPSASIAQAPTATIVTVNGNVVVSRHAATVGTVLQAGDTIQTQAGASVDVEFSDKSVIQISENTQVTIAELTRTSANVRTSHLTLIYGRLRALLSAGHQAKGSAFTIDTPNALVGVTFSQPDIEVSYDPEKQETIGIAHTVELIANNLLTNEQIVVPVGSSIVIVGVIMKVIAGTTTAAIAAEVASAEASAAATGTTVGTATGSGIGTGTMIALGVGVAAAGGVAAVVASSESGDDGSEETYPYSVSDLEGTWLGDLTFTPVSGNTGDSRIEEGIGFRFDAQGNVVNGTGAGGGFSSLSGNLTVSQAGELRGTLYAVIIVNSANNVLDTTTIRFEGHFTSVNRMDIVMTATYARNDGTGGSYILSGDLIRQ